MGSGESRRRMGRTLSVNVFASVRRWRTAQRGLRRRNVWPCVSTWSFRFTCGTLRRSWTNNIFPRFNLISHKTQSRSPGWHHRKCSTELGSISFFFLYYYLFINIKFKFTRLKYKYYIKITIWYVN